MESMRSLFLSEIIKDKYNINNVLLVNLINQNQY
jgi:hypothetical protein